MTYYLLIAVLYTGSQYERTEVVNPKPFESLAECLLAAKMMTYAAIVAKYECEPTSDGTPRDLEPTTDTNTNTKDKK